MLLAATTTRRPRRRQQPCKHCAASARRRSFSDSRLEPHPPQEVGGARVAAERLEGWCPSGPGQQPTASLKILFQPGKSLILVSQTCVDRCEVLADRFVLSIFPFKLFEYGERFGTLSRNRVAISEIAQRPPLSARQ